MSITFVGLGAVLVQENDENKMRVISTTSRTLAQTEQRMFPTELEICAIYHALQRFRVFIFNRKIIVRSDSISLSFMDKCKMTGSKLSRYIHEIMSHDIEIQYIKGTSNIFADMLSRIPRNQELPA